jgi:peptidoglycan/LPS O-acetylase OafA/YrhL
MTRTPALPQTPSSSSAPDALVSPTGGSPRAEAAPRVDLLDWFRLIAALAVVAYHHGFNGIQNGKITSLPLLPEVASWVQYGYLGVEFFFLISGYVIFLSALGRTPGAFAASRAKRLFPAFWCAVLITATAAQFWGGTQMQVSAMQVLANLTMVPGYLGQPFVDGVYWTLQLELGFYLVILLVLVWRHEALVGLVFPAWALALAVARVMGWQQQPFLSGYYAYFVAGALFGLAQRRPRPMVWAALLLAFAVCLEFSTGKAALLSAAKQWPFDAGAIGRGVVLIFLLLALLQFERVRGVRLPGAKLAGALTYPLYLVHAHLGYMLLSRFGNPTQRLLSHALVLAALLLIAWLLHRSVEQAGNQFWTMLTRRWVQRPVDALWRALRRPGPPRSAADHQAPDRRAGATNARARAAPSGVGVQPGAQAAPGGQGRRSRQ